MLQLFLRLLRRTESEKYINLSNSYLFLLKSNYKKKINETIRLYQLNIESSYSVYRSIDDNKLLFMNPIYPRTRNYSCKNINCISHKDDKNKEAVFFRDKDSYLTNYICGTCYNSWKV